MPDQVEDSGLASAFPLSLQGSGYFVETGYVLIAVESFSDRVELAISSSAHQMQRSHDYQPWLRGTFGWLGTSRAITFDDKNSAPSVPTADDAVIVVNPFACGSHTSGSARSSHIGMLGWFS